MQTLVEQRQPVWDSIRPSDHSGIHRQAVRDGHIREVPEVIGKFRFNSLTRSYYVPPDAQNWSEETIRKHGVKSLETLVNRFLTLSGVPWDGTYSHLWTFVAGSVTRIARRG